MKLSPRDINREGIQILQVGQPGQIQALLESLVARYWSDGDLVVVFLANNHQYHSADLHAQQPFSQLINVHALPCQHVECRTLVRPCVAQFLPVKRRKHLEASLLLRQDLWT